MNEIQLTTKFPNLTKRAFENLWDYDINNIKKIFPSFSPNYETIQQLNALFNYDEFNAMYSEELNKDFSKRIYNYLKSKKLTEDKQLSLQYDLYKCFCVIQSKKQSNKGEIINYIRGIERVVTSDVEKKFQSKFLLTPPGSDYEKSLIRLKFLSEGNPEETLLQIKKEAILIPGLQNFQPILRSIEAI